MASPFAGLSPTELGHKELYIFYGNNSSDSVFYTLHELDSVAQANVVTAIHSGVRIAAAVVLGTVLLLMARTYRSLLFMIYQLNFVLLVLSSALELGWVFSFNASLTEFLTDGDIPLSNRQLSVAASTFQVLLILSLLASLVLQIFIACGDLRRIQQIAVTALGIVGCFPTVLIWIWRLALVGVQELGASKGQNAYGGVRDQWVWDGAWRSFAASTSLCSLVLCTKLWFVHRKRVQMGVEQFEPIKILFTMAVQNSVIPAILAIVSAGISQSNFGGQSVSASTIPLTAVLLPTGYIWAQYNMLKGTQGELSESRGNFELPQTRDKFNGPDSPGSASSDTDSIKNGVYLI